MSVAGYQFTSKDAKKLLNGRTVRKMLDKGADRGVKEFVRRAPRRTGEFVGSVRVTEIRGRDGRPGRRISVSGKGALSIEFGTRYQAPAYALRYAIAAAEGRTGRGARGRRR